MSTPPPPSLFTIPTGTPFVDALADGILSRQKNDLAADPAALADVTILLPTRRACRSLREAFLRRAGNAGAVLLPRMMPLGDMDEEELQLAGAFDELPGDATIAPAVPTLHRQFLLAKQILARADDETPDQAVRLAQELARLLDQIHTERLDPAALKTLEDARHAWASHWQDTLTFLSIVTDHWPAVLAALGALDPAERRNRVLAAQANHWKTSPPAGPVIAAGSTGTVPATADLLAVVANMAQGAVVLPGLDQRLTDAVWADLPPSHPQFGMAHLLGHLGVERSAVADWPTTVAATAPQGRLALLSDALLPAHATETWRDIAPLTPEALTGVTRIEADTEQTEAAAIALVLRHALETPGRTAALVTPDRNLARRVMAELARFGLAIDDSAGVPLDQTAPGVFLRLAADALINGFAPVTLLSLLKHPLAGLGRSPSALRAAVRELEIAVLRGPRPGYGLDDLRRAVPKKARGLLPWLDDLEALARPAAALMKQDSVALGDVLRAHIAFAEGLAATDTEDGTLRLWAGDAGETLSGFIVSLIEPGDILGDMAPRHYAALFDTLMAGGVVRPHIAAHPRLNIWGPLEARLQHADVMVLGGLNEDNWPAAVETGPWMSRPMMEKFGLGTPERRIGLSAHDFVQACGAGRVVLTRARRAGGAPTVPSRWLVRLAALCEGLGLADAFRPDDSWTHWAARLDEPDDEQWTACPVAAPKPCPPISARPRQLSVTQVETWIRDPYAVYARHVLKLRALDPLDSDPGAAERGTIIHDALEKFMRAHPTEWPADPLAEVLRAGRSVFQEHMAWPAVRAFWWPRFERIAAWFVDFERARRDAGIDHLAVEVDGSLTIATPDFDFRLTARADRIDRSGDSTLSIVDYKTGRVPTAKQVNAGLSPQLALEAAIAKVGGFDGLDAAAVGDLTYVKVSGGREPGRERRLDVDADAVATEALDGLTRKVRAFASDRAPYVSRQRIEMEAWTGEYDHLARVKEWSSGGDT